MKKFDVTIVGASFSGLICAITLGKLGISTLILEKKKTSLDPVHTTGILPMEALDLYDIPSKFLYPIRKVQIYHKLGENLKSIKLQDDKYTFYGTKTKEVINFLSEEAIKYGAVIKYNTAFKEADVSEELISVNDEYETKFLIGADGACSRVARVLNLSSNHTFLRGREYHIKGLEKHLDNTMHVFLGGTVAKGYLAWATPNDGYAQVGLAVKQPEVPNMDNFMNEYMQKLFPNENYEIIEKLAGVIPINGTLDKVVKGNVILIGDAAGVVSPLTAGGIHRCFYYAEKVGQWIADYLDGKGKHPEFYIKKHYPKFHIKKFQRFVFDNFASDRLLHISLSTFVFRALAKKIFFK